MANPTIYDRFDPDKGWVALNFVAGRRLQSAEVNEIQSMSLYRDKLLGDALFGAGHIIEGGQILVSEDKKSAKLTAARAYAEGIIFGVPEQTLAITGQAEEKIGLKVSFERVTHEDDPTLLDPAVGANNFANPGAERKVIKATWVKDDPSAIPIYTLQNGHVQVASVPPELEGITPILARRTNDTNGSFLVSGMDCYVEPKDEDEVYAVIEAGKGYVLGVEINKLLPVRLDVPKSRAYRTATNETKQYTTATETYALNNKPVKAIVNLSATVEVTENITRGGTPGSADLLPKTPVVSIVEVKQGGTTYTAGRDYQLTGNYVDWSLAGTEPAAGTTYSVKYRYTKALTLGVDFELVNNAIHFLNGDRPVDGTTFQVTYEFFLARRDVIFLDSFGTLGRIAGQPDVFPEAPGVPVNVLALCELYLAANGDADDVVVTNYKPKRLTMLDLRRLLDRLDRFEYDQAMESLDKEAQSYDPMVAKKGVFTDRFTSFERADVDHPQFDAMLDVEDGILHLPIDSAFFDLEVNEAGTTARLHSRMATLPYAEECFLSQEAATETWNVNPYAVQGAIGTVTIRPNQDVWVEQSSVTRFASTTWSGSFVSSSTTVRVLTSGATEFMRQRDVVIDGEGFEPNGDNIQATFDGIPVALTPVGGSVAGSLPGTIRAGVDGKFSAKFTIPAGVRAGTRELRVWNIV